MKKKAKIGDIVTITAMIVAVITITFSAVLFVLSANQQRASASLTVTYVATNVYVEVDAKYQKKLDASPTALTGGPLTFQPTGVSSTGELSAGDIVLSPNDNYVLFTYSFKNKATVGGYDIAVTLTDTVNRVNTKVYYSYNDTSTAISTMATNMTNSKTTTAPQNITIPAQQTKYLYVYVEIDDWYFGASYTSDASHFLRFDISSTMIVNFESDYQVVDYIESTGIQFIDTGVTPSYDLTYSLDFTPQYETKLSSVGNCASFFGAYSNSSDGEHFYTFQVNFAGSVGQREIFCWREYRNIGEGYNIVWQKSSTGMSSRVNNITLSDDTYFYVNGNRVTNNGNTVQLDATSQDTFQDTILVFGRNLRGEKQPFDYFNLKVYGLSMSKGGVLIRNFVPCYRKSDNKPGMFDTVNGLFYTNRGTGEFLLPS